MSASDDRQRREVNALGKIRLAKQAVGSAEYVEHKREAVRRGDPREVALLNRLVPYLDLFSRLNDRELARLADVPEVTALQMRQQITQVRKSIGSYEPLLDRLDNEQLARVAQTTPKMFQYLRLCQPRHGREEREEREQVTHAARLRALTPPDRGTDPASSHSREMSKTSVDPFAERTERRAANRAPEAAAPTRPHVVSPAHGVPDAASAPAADVFEFSFVDDDD